MLEKLRGLAVFESVVKHGSFGSAAKELGITTSAVSQQIRSLEGDLGVLLLHRSTRKFTLTEAGEALYLSAANMVKAAEEGRSSINELRDKMLGSLRIATSPTLAHQCVLPALSKWLAEHEDLVVSFILRDGQVDTIDERADITIAYTPVGDKRGTTLMQTEQVLVASPKYLQHHDAVNVPQDLNAHALIGTGEKEDLEFVHKQNGEKSRIKTTSRLSSNSIALALDLAKQGLGMVKVPLNEAKSAIKAGELQIILEDYELPKLALSAITFDESQQPTKIVRCLKVLTEYFANKK